MDIVSVLILIITYKKCCMIDYGTTQMDLCLTQGAVTLAKESFGIQSIGTLIDKYSVRSYEYKSVMSSWDNI